MSVHPVTVYRWRSGEFSEPIPGAPDPEPGVDPPFTPDQPGTAGEQWLVAVGSFGPSTKNAVRGILWDAVFESLTVQLREMGPQRLTVRCPATAENLSLFGTPTDEIDQQGRPLWDLRGSINRELFVGSSLDGRPRWRFFVRGQVTVEGGWIRINAVGIIGGLTADRVMGSVRGPWNRLGTARGSFENGLTGWHQHGVTAEVVAGGVDANQCVRIKGVPDGTNYLEATWRYRQPVANGAAGQVVGGVYVKLPNIGPEIDDYGLMSMVIYDFDTGNRLWPRPDQGDEFAGVVTSDMVRGDWAADQVQCAAWGKWAPFDMNVRVRLYPTSATEWTYFDRAVSSVPEIGGLFAGIDRTWAIDQVFKEAQLGRDKSNWGVGVVRMANVGSLPEPLMFEYDENPSMDEVLEKILADEPAFEIWDDARSGRNVACGPRRGRVRTDLVIQPWDVVGQVSWTIDPGAQRTAVRGQNVSGASVLGSIDAGEIDYSAAAGQVIDVVLQGPRNMRQRSLVAWTRRQLATLSILQGSTTLLLSWEKGMRLAVGDTVEVALIDGRATHVDWMRVASWTPDLENRSGVLVQLGTDVDLGGR